MAVRVQHRHGSGGPVHLLVLLDSLRGAGGEGKVRLRFRSARAGRWGLGGGARGGRGAAWRLWGVFQRGGGRGPFWFVRGGGWNVGGWERGRGAVGAARGGTRRRVQGASSGATRVWGDVG